MILNPSHLDSINPSRYGAAAGLLRSLVETVKDAWERLEEKRHIESRNENPRERIPVLIVGHGDRWIEVYAADHVDVKLVIKPWMESAKGEILAEEYVEENLPWRYRPLYLPCNLRGYGLIQRVSPSELTRRQCDLAILKMIEELTT